MQFQRLIRDGRGATIEIHAILQRGHQTVPPLRHGNRAKRRVIQTRRCAHRKKHMTRRYPPPHSHRKVGILNNVPIAIAPDRSKECAGAHLDTLAHRKRRHRGVELLARGRVPRTEEDLMLVTRSVEKCQTGRIAVHEAARQVEGPAKARTEARRADALLPYHRIALQHYRGDGVASRLARRRGAGRAATDHQKIRTLQSPIHNASRRLIRRASGNSLSTQAC
jgi:hypothetical protein